MKLILRVWSGMEPSHVIIVRVDPQLSFIFSQKFITSRFDLINSTMESSALKCKFNHFYLNSLQVQQPR